MDTVEENPPTQPASSLRWTSATAVLSAAGALAACGGGASALPEAFASAVPDNAQRHILGVSAVAAAAGAVPLPTATELLDWAERNYGTFFPSHQADLSSGPYTYRYYPETGNYVGVAGSNVYILGPVAGSTSQPAFVGTLADFAPLVYATKFPTSDSEAARFLTQATLAVSDADIADVRSLGYEAWLLREMAKPPSASNWSWLVGKGVDVNPEARNAAIGIDAQIWQRLISAPDSLRQRVTLALSEIFVVGFDGITGPWKQFKMAGFWDLLANNAFGNYRALLEAISLNPAMGLYLSSAGNQKGNTATGRLPDENYAREVMQLFSIGLYELNADGSRKLDGVGKPIETYTQDAVTQLARVFTGWNVDSSPFDATPELARRPMVLNAAQHSPLSSTFLGVTVPANTDGTTALRITMDTLANHANVGPFIGRQLIQRLVTSNPSSAYVGRVAARWANNGAGVRGDLGAVVRAVLLDDEARASKGLTDPGFGKLREPMLRFIQWARTYKATSTSTDWLIGDLTDPAARLGQSPQRSPSVFNYFRPGYVPAGTSIAGAALVAPEFQVANESSVAGYLNFMQAVIPGTRFDLRLDYSAELALASDATALVDRVQRLLCANQLLADTRSTIVNAVNSIAATTDAGKANRVYTAVMLVMSCPDYLVQK